MYILFLIMLLICLKIKLKLLGYVKLLNLLIQFIFQSSSQLVFALGFGPPAGLAIIIYV